MSGAWIEVYAGLKNPAMRKVLGAVLLEQDSALGEDRATAKNLERWARIGLLVRGESGWTVNEPMLTEALAAQAKPATAREGVVRFFTGLKLDTLPARPAERLEVLTLIRDAVLEPGQRLGEAQLNERLRVVHPDVALLRRYMVDHGLLHRAGDGSVYTHP